MKSAPDAWLKKVSQLVEERGTTPVGKGKSRGLKKTSKFLLASNTLRDLRRKTDDGTRCVGR